MLNPPTDDRAWPPDGPNDSVKMFCSTPSAIRCYPPDRAAGYWLIAAAEQVKTDGADREHDMVSSTSGQN